MNSSRRHALAGLAACLGTALAAAPARAAKPAAGAAPAGPLVEVWKSPTCGCCKDWVTHMEGHGFTVKVNDSGNTAARKRLKVADKYGSCHTALVGGYVIEGHVPARDVQRLLKKRPAALGLAVPGMPVGSPGMDGPDYGNQKDPYDVLLLRADGSAAVFASYNKPAAKA